MIEVICGPMFSGKTEELIRRARRAEIGRKSVAVLKHSLDDRYDGDSIRWIASHGGYRIVSAPVSSPEAILAYHDGWDVLCLDEVQFFDLSLLNVAQRLSDGGTRLIIAGLDLTYRREPFGPMPFLLAMAEKVDKLTAICDVCGEDATLTQRLIDGRPAPFDGPTIQVGALDSYVARCSYCFESG